MCVTVFTYKDIVLKTVWFLDTSWHDPFLQLKLISEEDPWSERVDFLIEVMVSFFEKQQSQKEAINALHSTQMSKLCGMKAFYQA